MLNVGNFSRLIIGEIFNYQKLIYLDADSICNCDLYLKLKDFELEHDLYSLKANIDSKKRENRIILKMKNIINTNQNWEKIISKKIEGEDYVFMGAPFITNCRKWKNVLKTIVIIVQKHNQIEGGVYKLFTMSLQNIIFYQKTGDIKKILQCLPDLGSKRKKWNPLQLNNSDIMDWSGTLKPWFTNGLYRNIWIKHDILNLREKNKEINSNKNTIEEFQ